MLSVSIFIPYTPTGAISLPCVHLLYVYFNTKMARLHRECKVYREPIETQWLHCSVSMTLSNHSKKTCLLPFKLTFFFYA